MFSTVASTVQGTTSVFLDQDSMTEFHNVEVVCNISPTSTAEFCEVFVHGPDRITGILYTCVQL